MGFAGDKNTLYDVIMVNTCHYMFIQTHRMNEKYQEWTSM